MPGTAALRSVSEEELRAALEQAHVPSLTNALVHLTGETDLVRGEEKPMPVILGDPQGGISDEQQALVREKAFDTLLKYRNGELSSWSPDESTMLELARFISGAELSAQYAEYAMSELSYLAEERELSNEQIQLDDFHVAIIGAGMSGLLAAIRLQAHGIRFTIFEKNDDVGGTWYENQYPGCRVDTPNHVYSYAFAQNDWPQHFSDRKVLHSYFTDIAEQFNLRQHIRFSSPVQQLRYDTASNDWSVTFEHEGKVEALRADAVITAVGQLNRPKMPDIPGIESFAGQSFHSARWQHDVNLEGRRICIIGTGASAFQFTPEIVGQAEHVTVFLRTPPWVALNPVYHAHISDEVHWLLNNVPFYATWFRFHMFWTSGEGLLRMSRCEEGWNEHEFTVSQANDGLRQVLTAGLERELDGRPDLIEKLTPRYPPTAKRMLIDNGHWYRSLMRDNVDVIDTPIKQITESGVRTTDDTEYDCDVLIYGTGFQASKFLYPMDIYGLDGAELRRSWGEDPRAYKGITYPNYPNLFSLYGPNTNLVVNGSIIFFSECEMDYILECLKYLGKNNHRSLECKHDPFSEYNTKIDQDNLNMAWGASSVNAWYKNAKGRVTQNWPGSLVEFWQQTRRMDPTDYVFR